MTTLVAQDFTSFVFASNDEIKTTSLLVAEKFGKLHKDVLRKIESLDCSKEFHERNFTPMQIDVEIGNNATRKSPAFEMTKDGFMFLVMGFTGKAAAQIKEAYINAFNLMHAKLFQPRLEPTIVTRAQYGELSARMLEIAEQTNDAKKTILALRSRFNKHFRINSYKELPASKYDDALAYLEQKKLNYPATKEPEMKRTSLQGYASMILGINGNQRLVVQEHNDVTVVMKLNEEDFVGTFETVVRELKLRGYHVIKDDPENKLETIGKIANSTLVA